MIAAARGQEIEIFLNEQPDQPRIEGPYLMGAVRPHRLFRQSALPKRKAADFERGEFLGEIDSNVNRAVLPRRHGQRGQRTDQ